MSDSPSTPSPRWPASRQLWTLGGAIGVFTLTLACANAFLAPDRRLGLDAFGQDFMAFYSAGRTALVGRGAELYDFVALAATQHAIADRAGVTMAAPIAPWWNPPHVALAFAPLAMLPFRAALIAWTLIGLACLVAASVPLSRIVGEASPLRRHRWLVPAMLVACPATLQAIGHGQNTLVSMLVMTLVVAAWRARAEAAAGIACAMLFYKPQLAAIVALGLVATLGWRVIVGLMIGGIPQLLATLTQLPGALDAFVTRSAANLREIQLAQPYLWHRHATINGFLRHMLQGNAPGETALWITLLAGLGMFAVAAALTFAWWRSREAIADGDAIALDRFIAAVILATPLLVPFFFDYDLLLLTIAGVLVGREVLAEPDPSRSFAWQRRLSLLAFAWVMVNPTLAETRGINLTVPLLVAIFALHVRRCVREERVAIEVETPDEAVAATPEETSVRIAA